MEKILRVEHHKLISALFALFFAMCITAYGSFNAFVGAFSENLIALVIAIPLLIFFLFLSYFFFKIAINYNTYYLLKYNDRGFSYLHQPNIKGTTRSMTIQTFEKYYYKPKYYNFPFLYVKAFQLANNKIEIVYENNRIEKFPVELSQEKTKKGIVLLNSWLDAYNKKNIK